MRSLRQLGVGQNAIARELKVGKSVVQRVVKEMTCE
jgi:DNA-binding transcriptional regulator LsrR (DeoR family)